MNRPYYALAALVVVLGGSAVAVGPARCQSTTTSAALSSRSLCSSSPRDLVVAAHLFAQFDAGWEAGSLETSSGSEQGSDDNDTPGYNDSCGYDPYRGERYDAAAGGDDEGGTFAEECETWPSDERIDSGYSQFEQSNSVPVCGGDEVHCPYFGGPAVENYHHDCDDNFACGDADSEDACHRAYEQWLAEQKACEPTTSAVMNDESAFFTQPLSDSWKTAPVATPDWIAEYLNTCMPSLEEQYAEAELQAAREAESNIAATEYGPELPAAPAPKSADYSDEYESLYGLDAYLIPVRVEAAEADEEMEETETDNGPVVWSLSRIFGKVFEMVGELLPVVEEQAEELYDAADEALQQWNDLSAQLAMQRDDARVWAPYGENFDDEIISRDEQIVDVEPTLPVETAQSRQLLESLAGSLRAAGQLLLSAADGLEAEADRVLSAQHEEVWSR